MKQRATVRLELDSKAESVTLVRAALSAVAESARLDGEVLNDLKTAVSEACNNVVVHAYDGLPGPLYVDVELTSEGVTTTVRDTGTGMQGLDSREDGMGVGLAVISALAASAEFFSPPEGGTEVRMWFPTGRSGMPPMAPGEALRRSTAGGDRPDGDPPDVDRSPSSRLQLSGDVVVTVSPVSLMTPVLGRLARALAAGARFSFDRFSDVYLVADTIGAHAQRAATSDRVSFSLMSAGKRLELIIGPFSEGSGAELQRTASKRAEDSPLTLLADEILVDATGASETLHVVLCDRGSRAREKSL
jgi:anti-sigma regulatory factor (Ser/Thr protein kinase)